MLIASFAPSPANIYLSMLEYCVQGRANSSTGSGLVDAGVFCKPRGRGSYLASATWSIMVITGVGGTDGYPREQAPGETAVVALLVLLSAVVWNNVL
eukprot:7383801-Prymnesium_polylepis.3